MPVTALDRLVRKEVALGTIRELEPPTQHIGTRVLAPMQEVGSDDVIFDYAVGLTQEGLAPARAEDAESELAQKDVTAGGQGRAAILDWALKDHYNASDVTRYREAVLVAQQLGVNATQFPLSVGNMAEDFRTKVARDDALRRRKLDNRIEWLITQAVDTGGIAYNDGKIKFAVDYGRPANQHNQAPTGGTWNLTTSDPIGDILAVQEFMYDLYGVRLTRAIASRKVLNSLMNSDRFIARMGVVVGGTPSSPIDLNYLADGWGPTAARAAVERATNLSFIEYDAVYRTRPIGSTVVTNNRFLADNKVYFLPNEDDLADLDDAIGFGATLTSPHPEGNWTAGYYEWEEETRDPWGTNRGAGIKAFPVFPHMDLTYTMTVLP
jgi:hypothetical protein